MIPISPAYIRVYRGIRQAQELEKAAHDASGAELEDILVAKARVAYDTFEFAKQASVGQAVMDGAKAVFSHPVGKGLGMAAGAAVPAVIAGNMISNHATEQARNRALEAGAGLAGIGATMYGLHRLTSRNKTASENDADEAAVNDAIEKLAGVGYLDETLAAMHADTTGDAQKLAAELIALNREFGVEILGALIERATS